MCTYEALQRILLLPSVTLVPPSMGEWVPTAVVSNATNLLAVCSALFAFGFALGNLAARRGEHYHQQTRQQQQHEQQQEQQQGQQQGQQGVRRSCGSARGAKRKTRVRKSEENAKGKASRQVKPPPPSSSSGDLANDNANAAAATTKHLSRRTRNRMKKLAPKDLALDAFTRVARSHVACIGSGDYEFLLLLPRKAFLAAGRFVPYADCRDRLVTLGEARRASTAGGGVDQLRVLYVSLSRANPGEGARDDWESKDWESKNFETARALLRRCPDLGFVYVGRSCVVAGGDSDGPAKRVEQLRHVPSVLLRADVVLVLPGQAGDDHADGNGDDSSPPGPRRRRHHRHSDFRFHAGGAWARMELALAAVGQAKVYVTFRAKPYPESLCELKPGKSDVGETTRQAAEALQVAATAGGGGGEAMTTAGGAEMIDPMSAATGMKRGEVEDNAAAAAVAAATAAAVVNAARENWVGTDLNPLAALEEARLAVTAAEKSDDADILESIKGMRPVPNPGFAESARASLGEERAEGSRELALSLLLFAVLCSQPKARATYTDAFVEDAGKLEISYRPIAVVRSPYRERFGTPRQPQVTASVLHGGAQEGQIVFLKGHGYGERDARSLRRAISFPSSAKRFVFMVTCNE